MEDFEQLLVTDSGLGGLCEKRVSILKPLFQVKHTLWQFHVLVIQVELDDILDSFQTWNLDLIEPAFDCFLPLVCFWPLAFQHHAIFRHHLHITTSIGFCPSYHRSVAGGMSTGYKTDSSAACSFMRSSAAKYMSFCMSVNSVINIGRGCSPSACVRPHPDSQCLGEATI